MFPSSPRLSVESVARRLGHADRRPALRAACDGDLKWNHVCDFLLQRGELEPGRRQDMAQGEPAGLAAGLQAFLACVGGAGTTGDWRHQRGRWQRENPVG